MAKYKRRHKKNSVLLIGIAVVAILIFISTGYALWSDTLYIKGTANARYVEQKLDTITVNKTSGQYLEFKDNVGIKAFKVTSTELNNTEEKIEVVGNYERKNWNVRERDAMIRLNFVNNYPVTITNGQIALIEDSTGYSLSAETTATVANNETGTATITFHLKANSDLLSGTIKYKISYIPADKIIKLSFRIKNI